ncbi:uncharacterized protein SETTUDRAFT_136688 [Exserohilum turcica Et28A]|uniref:DUF6590 domain-containing protein n=1 Tax=Exserohilum turcicum (strain 28A) TaxID=671987 RepID=R0IIE8_EXST2|nr:uncharacterized protein SETTUDRAFT_136688 [Exserohilum turcica Et28A]EOA84701.1 hypothetical protein SETTUDRAFT_136688 [Exserohilum turcica Et28A]
MSQPQSEWSPEHNTYLCTQWDPQQGRFYRTKYVNGQWVFLDWLPVRRADSPHDIRERPAVHRAVEGPTIVGTYNPHMPTSNGRVERLDPSYCVRDGSFFRTGKVFSVLFSEAAGSTATPYNDSFSVVKFGEVVHSQIRRFIVISPRQGFCYAIPIFTYNGNGTKKPGLDPIAHAIAYSEGYLPSLLEGETKLEKEPICKSFRYRFLCNQALTSRTNLGITMTPNVPPLVTASRIFFGIHHPIQHNVKVKDVGKVHPDDITNLLDYWNMHNPVISA